MPATPSANLSFLPWVRQGAATAIAAIDTLGPQQSGAANVSITLSVNNAPVPAVAVRLRGPADVVGIDVHQIVRTDPRPGTGDFEPNCFASIEFDRADFPWLFTPARANANGQLRPWLCLVVIRKQDGVRLTSTVDSPLPILQIATPAKPFIELPDLKECWAWAHSQAAADTSVNPNAVGDALNGAPELSLSRLVCPRLLAANTEYLACVVPTFELGRKAGLGLAIADADLTAVNAMTTAWTLTATAPALVQLPVYYSWEFRTSQAGDFEALARRLKIASPSGLGQRCVDISNPGFELPAGFPPPPTVTTVKVEGALMPLNGTSSPVTNVLWSDPFAAPFEQGLANVVDQPGLRHCPAPAIATAAAIPTGALATAGVGPFGTVVVAGGVPVSQGVLAPGSVLTSPGAPGAGTVPTIVSLAASTAASGATTEPLLAPPLYGRWHAGRALVTPGAANWFDELNLDPRWRSVAALGTSVIQQHQEALMASAWDQAAQIQQVNQRMRQLQVSMAIGESLHARHLMKLSEDMTLRFASPAFSRLRMPAPGVLGPTLTAQVMQSILPVPATQTAMRRIGRQRGPLTRRIAAQGYTRIAARTWVAMLNTFSVPPPPPRPAIVRASLPFPPTVDMVVNATWSSSFQIAPENQPLPFLPAVDPLPAAWDYPGAFRAAAAAHLARIPLPSNASLIFRSPLDTTAGLVRDQMRPRVVLANLARAIVTTGDNVLPPTAPGVTPVGTESVMMAPSFSQPMYEPLKDKSQDLLLPGLDKVDVDSVVGLKTNRAFVEAYMIGLNFEMGRELLWRGFPTDQQGTYFKNFWGNDTGAAGAADIDDLRKNLGRALGTAPPNAPADQFVLLLRSGLLRRYPNAIVYLTPALTGVTTNPPPDVFPMFNGAMDPDVNFFGFAITAAAAVGSATNPGYFVVIQEHPTEPRFGLDAPVVNTLIATKSHLAIGTQPPAGVPLKGHTWGRNSAHMADITRRLPVRITIHASQLVAVS